MECGFVPCLKYIAIGVGAGLLAGGALYFLTSKRSPMFGPRAETSTLPAYEEPQPATAGFGWQYGRYGRRRW